MRKLEYLEKKNLTQIHKELEVHTERPAQLDEQTRELLTDSDSDSIKSNIQFFYFQTTVFHSGFWRILETEASINQSVNEMLFVRPLQVTNSFCLKEFYITSQP